MSKKPRRIRPTHRTLRPEALNEIAQEIVAERQRGRNFDERAEWARTWEKHFIKREKDRG